MGENETHFFDAAPLAATRSAYAPHCCAPPIADGSPGGVTHLVFATMVWDLQGRYIDFGVHFGSVVLGLNNAQVSVGQDVAPTGTFAVAYIYTPQTPYSTLRRVLLLPPKNTSWVGTATGINDAGRIVGYATFSGGGRAV